MKAFIAALVVLFCVSAAAALDASSDPSLGDIHISLIEGDVQIDTEDTKEWVPGSINMPLRAGDRLWVPEGGKAELHLRDGATVRLNENTSLDVLTVEERSAQFFLNTGRVYVVFRGRSGSFLQMDTPVSSSRVYERAKFRADVTEKDFVDIYVYEGRVSVDHDGSRSDVTAGKRLSLTGRSLADLQDLSFADEWEKWNRERDRRLDDDTPGSRHLPEELSSYSSDLDRYGRWERLPDYGYCWTPARVVVADWAPYQAGRWIWVRGDYVWLSYEPWGWVPYHYGRWVYLSSRGWFWVPPRRGAVYWGPGFVGWVHTPTYVAWAPLAPGEIYYGYGHYGPHSVNLFSININTVVIKKVYRNAHVNHGVTVIHRESFGAGRHERIRVRENPFIKERISVGRPDIRPRRESAIPVIKDIHSAKQPPARVRDIKVDETKRRRPMVREQDRSPLSAGASREQASPGRRERSDRADGREEHVGERRDGRIRERESDRDRSRELRPPADDKRSRERDIRPPAPARGTGSEAARPSGPAQQSSERRPDQKQDQKRERKVEQDREQRKNRLTEEQRLQTAPERREREIREREKGKEQPREQTRDGQRRHSSDEKVRPEAREDSERVDGVDRRDGRDGRGKKFGGPRERVEGGEPFTPNRGGASGR